ncbi:MAG: choice-of-anchor L domain-containing protein [Myxococcales bacterium]|nr:choice-of-anchor L domain-containing protein [Myxococcales bacterium]
MKAAAPVVCLVASIWAAVACGGSDSTSFSPGGTDGGDASASGGTSTGGASSGGSSASGGSGGSGNTANTGGLAGGGTGGDAGPTGCQSSADCAGNPGGPICETATGNCVGCLGASDCPSGQWCNTATKQCGAGCDEATDCSGATPLCDSATNTCVGCLADTDCPSGQICSSKACATGCSVTQPCPNSGDTCCTASCHDLQADVNNCGACGTACAAYPNAATSCASGACSMGACAVGFADCNESPSDGCEWNLTISACACKPGSTQSCYTGPAGTSGVGACKAGQQTCDASGLLWGPCLGQIVPSSEVCANNVDEDCNGTADDVPDTDGDGWTKCNGDCCETPAECSKPNKVNPGAFEVVGNQVDDDCDPATSDTVATADCATTAKLTGVTAQDVARAIDLCQFTTANPPPAQKKWGVITYQHLLPNGTAPTATALSEMQNWQTAVLQNYGTGGIVPTKGPTMAGISSGRMRDQNDAGYVNPNSGATFSTTTTPPPAYLAAHGNALPASAGCSGTCPAGSGANDPVNVRLTIRVPTNALSFSYKFRFFSSEYWTYQCTVFNDFYLALLTTGAAGIPADKNISFDSLNNPVSVNNGFFDLCAPKGCNTCPFGMGELAGTGMQLSNTGGGTKWLTTTAPVVPGEVITIEFMVFDVSDHILDSLTILDNWQWSLDPSSVGTTG